MDQTAALLRVRPEELDRAVRSLYGDLQSTQKEIGKLRGELARQQMAHLAESAARISPAQGAGPAVAVVAAQVPGGNMDILREMSDWLRDKLGSAVVVLATAVDGKPQMIAAVTEDVVSRGVRAGDLVKTIARTVGGSGGGRPTLAQAGGKDMSRLDEALGQVAGLVRETLK